MDWMDRKSSRLNLELPKALAHSAISDGVWALSERDLVWAADAA